MPLVEVTIIEGRPAEKKTRLIKEVTDVVVKTLDAPPEAVRVIIREVPAAHWGVGGVPKG
jgi:4-oxalocrotonate tautomerase